MQIGIFAFPFLGLEVVLGGWFCALQHIFKRVQRGYAVMDFIIEYTGETRLVAGMALEIVCPK